MDEPNDAEDETDTEVSDEDDEEEEEEDAAREDPAPATAPRTGARSILRFFGFGQRDPPVSPLRQCCTTQRGRVDMCRVGHACPPHL